MDKNIWQPYLQTRAEYLSEDKSVTMATDLKQMNDTELSVLQKRLVNFEDFPIEKHLLRLVFRIIWKFYVTQKS